VILHGFHSGGIHLHSIITPFKPLSPHHNVLSAVIPKHGLVQKDMITIYFDGLCRPRNPGGVATYGYVIYKDGKQMKSGYGVVGSGAGMTNNVAEYSALKHALEWVREHCTEDMTVIKGDSQLVINQLNGTWQVKSETSKKYVPEIRRLLEGRKTSFIWIPRGKNAEADQLSNIAYNQAGSRDPSDSAG
jgi:ribonuclease HI